MPSNGIVQTLDRIGGYWSRLWDDQRYAGRWRAVRLRPFLPTKSERSAWGGACASLHFGNGITDIETGRPGTGSAPDPVRV